MVPLWSNKNIVLRVQFPLLLLTLGPLFCASKSLKPGESEPLINEAGRQVGTVTQITLREKEYIQDADRNGMPEYKWQTKDEKFTAFDRYDTKTGKLRSRSYYVEGKLNRIEVYTEAGKIRGIVSYPDGVHGRSVELPERRRLVEFISDK